MAENGTAPGLVVSGTDPVDVLADFDTTTDTLNNTPATASLDRTQQFADDISATINVGVTIDGFGLALETTKTGGTVTVTNNGTIVVDDPAANGKSALAIIGNGGTVSYAGSGNIGNATGTPNSAGLEIFNSGDIEVETDGGVITGASGISASTGAGAISVTMTGGQIGTSAAPTDVGIAAVADSPTGKNISVTAEAIFASAVGIFTEISAGSGNTIITANGAISADVGIDARLGSGGGGGGTPASGDILITNLGGIAAVSAGIDADTNKNSTGNIVITSDAAITVSAGTGIRATTHNGSATLTVYGTVEATGGHAIVVQSDTLADSSIYVAADVTAHGTGFAGIGVSGGATNVVSVDTDATVSGEIGIESFSGSTKVVVNGAVEGTGGTAIAFDALSAGNVLELKTTGAITGNVTGSGSDRLVLCDGANAGSFDLDQILSGFSKIEKEDASTWTISGTLVADTLVHEGTLILNGATVGNTTVGTAFTSKSATLSGTGTLGNVMVNAGGTLATGAGILHAIQVTFDADATFVVHGELEATGTINLGGATLRVAAPLAFDIGDTFLIIDNRSQDPIGGTFAGLADGAQFASGGWLFTIDYDGGDGDNDVVLTVDALAGLIIAGSGPVDIAASVNVTTVNAENTLTDVISDVRRQTFNDDVEVVIDDGVTVNGWGLHLTSQKTGGSVSVVNNGAVVLDDTAARQTSALTIVGHGGLVSYSGSGDVRNEVTTPFGNDGLRISNAGDISVEISDGVISGKTGAFLFASGGAITLDMTGGEIRTSASPVARLGVEVTSVNADHDDVTLTTQKISGILGGIDVLLTGGTGNITITANGAISADTGNGISTSLTAESKFTDAPSAAGNITITTKATIDAALTAIDASVGSGGGKDGGGSAVGDIDVTTYAAITAGGTGIAATIGSTGTGNITITANGSISADFEGIYALIDFAGKDDKKDDSKDGGKDDDGGKDGGSGGGGGSGPATAGPGDIKITANATVDSTETAAIYAANPRGSIDIAVNADVTSHAVGFAAISVAGEGSALIEIAGGATVKGETGFESLHSNATLVVSGTLEGTGGTAAVFFDGANILEMETTGTLVGSATGGGADTLVLCGGGNATASFDLNQIISGFTQIAKEEDSTWTVSGTLAVDTFIDEGTIVLANATVGDTTVGTVFTLVSATLAGSGTVGTLTVSSKAILSIGTSAGVIHSGNVAFEMGAIFAVELGGTAAGTQYDQLDVTGTVDLGDATLDLSRIGAFIPVFGATFVIVANDSNDDVTGTFFGLAEGAHFTIGGLIYSITYAGGEDGNDVVLTALGSSPPTDISLSPASVAENIASGTIVGALSDVDPDAGDTATFTLLNNAGGRFRISGSNLVVSDGGLLNFEQSTSHAVIVRVTDSGGLTFDKGLTVTLTNVNEAPSDISLSPASVAENSANGTIVGALSDIDPDAGDTATFTLLNDAGGRFGISGSNLVVSDGGLLNFEQSTSHAVTVRVTDGGGLTFDKDFTVTLTNVNEAPSDISLSNASVAENSAGGTIVGALSDIDPDVGDTAAFTLLNDAGGRFAISGANLVVVDGSLLNFEQSTSQAVTVRVTDSGGLTFDKAFTVTSTNINEAPTDISLSNASVAENSANGTVVGALSDTDPDAGDTATFTLLNNAGGRFAISDNDLVVADSTLLNFERGSSHVIAVRVTDSGGLTSDKAFTIAVTDVAETPHWNASVDVGPHPAGWLPSGLGDFNADATSDLAWYNSATGNIDIWKLSNGQWAGSVDVGNHPAGYEPVSFADFNYDGTGDVLWYNPTTQHVDLWKIANGQWAGSVDVGVHPAEWQPKGFGDFDGDGTTDIAWHNPTTNAIDIWKIVDGRWAGSVDVGSHPAGYQPALIGDFNGDGTSDIGWYDASTGDVDIWKISNGQWAGSVSVGSHPGGWQPLGTGDFNEDGTSDIVWYNPASNNIDIWLINHGQWAGSFDIGSYPAGAVPVGVGDFDHNGVSDVMWRDTTTGRIDNWMLAYS